MTRIQALEIAKKNHALYQDGMIEHLFRGASEPDAVALGYRHGWIIVGEFSFNEDEITGIPYDITQGGWAFI